MTGAAAAGRCHRRAYPLLAGAAALVLTTSCARLVTIDPGDVAGRNRGWHVRRTPGPPTTATEDAPSTPAETPAPSASEPAPPPPIQPLPFARRPDVERARRSQPDRFGVPVDLYAVDPLLATYRADMDIRRKARVIGSTPGIASGAFLLGLSAWWFLVYSTWDVPDEDKGERDATVMMHGSMTAVFGLISLVSALHMASSSPDPTPLQSYYRETYLQP
jgi:hypothetical protein